MANPRDLAEQAIALLQNALSESEARASELDEQLKRKRQPKNRLEEQLDVLTHRLEKLEAERAHWERQAGHLEEVAEAERTKVAQLKKKLEIAENGPDKITKKEINFWRAKAADIDAETKEYRDRLAALRRELNERDAALEQLEARLASAAEQPSEEPAHGEPEREEELRGQLEQRDRWLAELRLELHELRAQPTPPLEVQAEVETLQRQIAALEHSAAATAAARAMIEADLARAQSELTEHERALREAAASAEHAKSTLGDREHRIVELSAEVEQLRHELRQRSDQERAENSRHVEHAAQVERELESLRTRLEDERQDASAARAALQGVVIERERELESQRQLLAANETDFRELREQLAERDTQLHEHRRHEAEREQSVAAARRQIEERSRELAERDRQLRDQANQVRELNERLADRERKLGELVAELEQAHASIASHERDLDEARSSLMDNGRELEHARTAMTTHEREVASLRETLLETSRELDALRSEKRGLEASIGELAARLESAENELSAAREKVAGLESELHDEREHAENLGELANERREHMTKLQEQLEEAEERYAEANWRLGKSHHFARIVKRRRGLVLKLLAALRAKMKANVALKAGLDGLRTYKAGAEQNQQKLLQRIDTMKVELREAEETIKKYQSGTAGKQELATALARATALEERLNTQAELIQSLETELKTTRLGHKPDKPGDDKSEELEQLRSELEAKTRLLEKLQADADEQQRKLSKLRGSESETMRLRAMTEKDRGEIESLQQELASLREALAARDADGAPADAAAEAKLKERDTVIARLKGTIKEHEATIKKLSDSAEGWKRKYQFLATDSPEAYKASSEK